METFAQYKQRLLGYLGDRDPLEVLAGTPASISTLIGRLDRSAAATPPAAGKWSAAQIVAHLSEVEIVNGYRLRSVLAKSGAPIIAYDQDAWAKTMRYEEVPPEASVQRFAVLREWNVVLLRQLTPEQWERFGIHEERGRESIRDMAHLTAGHDLNHLSQIERIVEPAA